MKIKYVAEEVFGMPKFEDMRNWVWLSAVAGTVAAALMGIGVWVAEADEAHKKATTAEQAIVAIQEAAKDSREAKKADEDVLRALCINPEYVKSAVCVRLKLRLKEK